MRAFIRFLRELPVPITLTLLAALLSVILGALGPRLAFGLFIAAVVASAWWGGLRAACVSTVASAALRKSSRGTKQHQGAKRQHRHRGFED